MPTRKATVTPPATDIEGALAALGAEELREAIRELLCELDERAQGRAVSSLIHRAARRSGWAPAAVSNEDVAEVLAFVEAAEQEAYADPSDFDDLLLSGSTAFLRKDYQTAFEIFGALLPPLADGEIHLGQDEMVDEVLGVDAGECAVQFVVSAYMTSAPKGRAAAVRSAIDTVQGLLYFTEPLEELERTALEPLPGLDEFLPEWRALIEGELDDEPRSDWDSEQDRWLREVVQRLEGSKGLEKIARSSGRADDLRAWCRSLVKARDWKAALSAFDAAAELVAGKEYVRGEFLDGAALAAQELGRKDLPARLERGWREAPSVERLSRWLGAAGGKASLRKRAADALAACPKQDQRQRALLHVLLGDLESAARLLASAPGLGWSDPKHPGRLLFPVLQALLAGKPVALSSAIGLASISARDFDDLEAISDGPEGPRLATPELDRLFALANLPHLAAGPVREVVLDAMCEAAESRVEGVTGNKRRNHYGDAASLVAICAGLDPSPVTDRWV
ncbi:MAG TPA: hypothetical protein DFS52_01430, partial [Myxococcales bacterium]|nr:hypothetical protein [Myxococcales bacterium]